MADREHIKRRVSAYRERLAEIRADRTLSPLGKRRAIEALYRDTKAEVDPIRRQMAEQQVTTERRLERTLFGLASDADPSAVIAYRDAQDRVSAVKRPEHLDALMERALRTGDESLLRAAAGHAWSQSRNPLASDGWGALVDAYIGQNPAAKRDYEQFLEANRSMDPTRAFLEKMSLSLGGEPAELRTPEDRLSDAAPRAESSSWGATA